MTNYDARKGHEFRYVPNEAIPSEGRAESRRFLEAHGFLNRDRASAPKNAQAVEGIPDGTYVVLNIGGMSEPYMNGATNFEVMANVELTKGLTIKMLDETGIKPKGYVTVKHGKVSGNYKGTLVGEKAPTIVGKETLDFIVEHATPK